MACVASIKDISPRLFIHSLIHFCLIIHLWKGFFYWWVRPHLEEDNIEDSGKNARLHELGGPYTDLLQDLGDCFNENKLVHLIEKRTRTE